MLDKTFYLVKKNNKSDIVHDRNHTQGYMNMGILYVNSSESIQDIGSSSILYFLYFSYFQIDIPFLSHPPAPTNVTTLGVVQIERFTFYKKKK